MEACPERYGKTQGRAANWEIREVFTKEMTCQQGLEGLEIRREDTCAKALRFGTAP